MALLTRDKPSGTLPIVAPIADRPDFAAVAGRRAEMRAKMIACQDELRAVEHKIAAALAESQDGKEARIAEAILRGEDAGTAEAGARDLIDQAHRLETMIAAYRRADSVLRAQMEAIRGDISVEVAATLDRPHRAAVRGILAALDGLRTAIAAEEGVRSAMTDAGYDARLPSDFLPPFKVDDPTRYEAADWERRARAYAR